MSDIFISYRREDSADVTGRINDHLFQVFGEEKVFTDVDNIPLGVDFRDYIDKEVAHCAVFIAVIGPGWLKARNEQGQIRLDDATDFVRIEIESALNRDIPVIPVLVGRANMPTEQELPASIKSLAYRNATSVGPDPDFRNHIKRLIKGIHSHISEQNPTETFVEDHNATAVPVKKPGTIITDKMSSGGQGPQIVVIPPGIFLMGSPEAELGRSSYEGPRHEVTIESFAMGKYEVTFDEYDRFAKETGRKLPDDEDWGRGKRPVINVSWDDAVAYTAWLSEQTGQNYRLPSEAEWEYAARAGTTTPFNTGECISTDQANYDGNYDYAGCGAKTGVYRGKTIDVGSFKENAFGLHDMHGNVWEWTADCWNASYDGAPADGSARDSGDCTRRVVRGGGWSNEPEGLRSAARDGDSTDGADSIQGFRLARTF